MFRHLAIALVAILLSSVVALDAHARRPIRNAFFTVYPSAETTRLDELLSNASHCGVCHFDFDGGGPRNAYGLEVEVAINSGNFADEEAAISSLDGNDSDNDGATNNEEITDLVSYINTPTFPGLKSSTLSQTINVDQSEIEDYLTPTAGADAVPPVAQLVSPTGGESFDPHSMQTVEWSATDDVAVARVDLLMSDDGGATFKPIARDVGAAGTYSWFVPNLPGSQTLIRVAAYDPAGNLGEATSGSFTVEPVEYGTVPTTLRDFELPGTQPLQGVVLDDPTVNCVSCHGNYDTSVEPWHNWRGSMMGQAARDPLFLATVVIAEQDAPSSGDLCIRCHSPGGWSEGRSTDTSGAMLNAKDREAVQCDFCHRLVDPVYEVGVSPSEDEAVLNALDALPVDPANGQFVLDPDPIRRGPYADAQASHQFLDSAFHRESDLCATCHDVSNPAFVQDGDPRTYAPDAFDAPHVDGDRRNMFPVERTFSEWSVSEYASSGVYAPQFAGNKSDGIVSSCQDCHMSDVSGVGANVGGTPTREDLGLHDFTGGNHFIPDILPTFYPDEVDVAQLADAKARAVAMLQKAATVDLSTSVVDYQPAVTVTVTNETAHKLPSGYPEGRRMWLQVRGYDGADQLVYVSGDYDASTGVLSHDEDLKIYHIKPGTSERLAAILNTTSEPSFHFVLNDTVFFDNRIPPRGFTNAAFEQIQSPAVGYSYADGQNSDATTYLLPVEARRVEVDLLYQTTSKEYIEFLRDENTTNTLGQQLYDAWVAAGRAAPVTMASAAIQLDVTAAEDTPERRPTGLRVAYPNPFNPRTVIPFDLARSGYASLRIYDMRGRLVRVLVDGEIPAGSYEAKWHGQDRAGRQVASGTYFARLETEGHSWKQKLSLVR